MSEIELSICIATYNRERFLGQTLESISAQLTDSMEIVIVDGASTDGTPSVVAPFVARDRRIRYHRQAENGGVDRDFAHAVEVARGRYCWLFSDDDLLKPNALARVSASLREGHSFIVVNAEVRNADLSAVIDPNRLQMSEDRSFAIGADDDLFAAAGKYLTFIGGVVIDRAVWLARAKEPYFGTEFIHIGVIFQAPLPGTALIVAEPLIVIRYGNAKWSARGFEIWMFKWPRLVWSLPLSERAKSAVVAREPWRSVASLLLLRALGAYSVTEFRSRIAPIAPALPRAVASIIARLPQQLLNTVAVQALRFVRRPTTTAIDLRNSRRGPAR